MKLSSSLEASDGTKRCRLSFKLCAWRSEAMLSIQWDTMSCSPNMNASKKTNGNPAQTSIFAKTLCSKLILEMQQAMYFLWREFQSTE